MLITTSPVRILFRGTWSDESAQGEQRIAFRSGKLVEYVKVMDESTGDICDWTLAEHINGEVNPGDLLSLTCEVRAELQAQRTARGGSYTTTKYKYRITDAKPVPAAVNGAKA